MPYDRAIKEGVVARANRNISRAAPQGAPAEQGRRIVALGIVDHISMTDHGIVIQSRSREYPSRVTDPATLNDIDIALRQNGDVPGEITTNSRPAVTDLGKRSINGFLIHILRSASRHGEIPIHHYGNVPTLTCRAHDVVEIGRLLVSVLHGEVADFGEIEDGTNGIRERVSIRVNRRIKLLRRRVSSYLGTNLEIFPHIDSDGTGGRSIQLVATMSDRTESAMDGTGLVRSQAAGILGPGIVPALDGQETGDLDVDVPGKPGGNAKTPCRIIPAVGTVAVAELGERRFSSFAAANQHISAGGCGDVRRGRDPVDRLAIAEDDDIEVVIDTAVADGGRIQGRRIRTTDVDGRCILKPLILIGSFGVNDDVSRFRVDGDISGQDHCAGKSHIGSVIQSGLYADTVTNA